MPLDNADEVMILIHGRGATAESMFPVGRLFAGEKTAILAPQATNQTWYPNSFMAEEKSNQPWLDSAVEYVEKVLQVAIDAVGSKKVFLLGFSQGACLTTEVAARNANQYGGIIAFTGGLIGQEIIESRYQGDFAQTKIYVSNGDNDPHIPVSRSTETKKIMEKLNGNVQLEIFSGRPHTIIEDEVEQVQQFIFS